MANKKSLTAKASAPAQQPEVAQQLDTYQSSRNNPALFGKLLEGRVLAGMGAITAIREGYSASILKSASHFFHVTDARIQNIARVSATTAHRLQQKNARIDAAATERLYRLSMVTREAIDVFEHQEAAITWMRQTNPVFGGVAPMDLMDTEPGATAVKQVLNAIATGGAA